MLVGQTKTPGDSIPPSNPSYWPGMSKLRNRVVLKKKASHPNSLIRPENIHKYRSQSLSWRGPVKPLTLSESKPTLGA